MIFHLYYTISEISRFLLKSSSCGTLFKRKLPASFSAQLLRAMDKFWAGGMGIVEISVTSFRKDNILIVFKAVTRNLVTCKKSEGKRERLNIISFFFVRQI